MHQNATSGIKHIDIWELQQAGAHRCSLLGSLHQACISPNVHFHSRISKLHQLAHYHCWLPNKSTPKACFAPTLTSLKVVFLGGSFIGSIVFGLSTFFLCISFLHSIGRGVYRVPECGCSAYSKLNTKFIILFFSILFPSERYSFFSNASAFTKISEVMVTSPVPPVLFASGQYYGDVIGNAVNYQKASFETSKHKFSNDLLWVFIVLKWFAVLFAVVVCSR